MSAYGSTSYSIAAGPEGSVLFRPRGYVGDGTQRAAIFLTGGGGTAVTTLASPFRKLPQYLAGLGVPVLSIDCGNNAGTAAGYAWGNDIAATRIELARTTTLTLAGLKNDKVALIGGSGGFCNALQYARQFPARVGGVAGIVGLVDLDGFRDSNIGGFQAAIDTQYGGNAAFEAAVPTHSPLAYAATIQAASYPVKGWWSSNDTSVLPATVDAFCAAAPRVTRVNVGATDHAIPSTYDADIADFVIASLA